VRYEDVVLADAPVGYWPLNEMSGTTAYNLGSLGSGNNGTYTGTFVYGAREFPSGGRAPYFDGSTSWVNCGDNAAFSPAGSSGVATIEAWVSHNTTSGNSVIVAKQDGAANTWEGIVSIENYVKTAGYWSTSGFGPILLCDNGPQEPLRTPKWGHVVYIYDRATPLGQLWINGRLVVSTTTATGTVSDTISVLSIGARNTQTPVADVMKGSIAHVAFYNKVLNAERVYAHYSAGLGARYGLKRTA
jgi:hypothetical protein